MAFLFIMLAIVLPMALAIHCIESELKLREKERRLRRQLCEARYWQAYREYLSGVRSEPPIKIVFMEGT